MITRQYGDADKPHDKIQKYRAGLAGDNVINASKWLLKE
jgi:hypothetical protein